MTIEVRVAGSRITDFVAGSCSFSLGEAVGSFDVEYMVSAKQSLERALFPGDAVELLVDGYVLLQGHVDTTDDEDGPQELKLRAAGRTRSADLVDCSVTARIFKRQTVGSIARLLAEPFDVPIEVDGADSEQILSFAAQRGETPAEVIGRAAARAGMHLYARGGALVLGTAKLEGIDAHLMRGQEPLIRTARSDSWHERFSVYVFRGQVPSSDETFGKAAAQLKGSVLDPEITRYRPLMVQVSTSGAGDLATRAAVVRNQRAGQGQRVLVTLDGLTAPSGKPWAVNTLVHLVNEPLAINDVLLVSAARMRFGALTPPETELELMPPEAWDVGRVRALRRHVRAKWTK